MKKIKRIMKCKDCKGKRILKISEAAQRNNYIEYGVVCEACGGTGKISLFVFIKQLFKL